MSGMKDVVTAAAVEPETPGIPNDPYLNSNGLSQWQLVGAYGLHADKVWGDYTGTGVVVADLDDGFQISHPDLTANYRTDLDHDFRDNDADASAGSADNHGTAVLGEMIADDNGVGGVGVAFDAQGFGIRMGFGAAGDLDQISNGFDWARTQGAAVLNNSWAFTGAFDDDFGAVSGSPYFGSVATALEGLADNGRGGLGSVIVFAAGNSRADGDNVNYHNLQNSPYAITVAAIDQNGVVAGFSNPGTAILVSAGGVNDITTDRTGNAGYAAGDYIYFSGTSAAAPVVSGLAALMLQANPNLGWRDVQEILALSAQHNDPGRASWATNGAGLFNGGGLHYSADYGFGAADALSAIRLAESWTMQQDSANMVSLAGGTASPNLAIGTGAAQSAITVSQTINVERVLVNLDLSDSSIGGLTVTLIAPSGMRSVLIDHPTASTSADSIQFQVTSLADWGESSAGTWRLQVQDDTGGSSGSLHSWSIGFLGSAISANNSYFYTNEFATYSGADLAARSVIHDAGAGNDTLNLAAVTSGSTIDLNARTGTIAGNAVTIAAGTVLENIYGGDGNDHFIGGAAAERFYGGRGNDLLQGGAGSDYLDGGAGNDTVFYEAAIASFSFLFGGGSQVAITDLAGRLGVDTVLNVENFNFLGTVLDWGQLNAYVAALPPPASAIDVAFPTLSYHSPDVEAHRFTAAAFGASGTTGWVQFDHDAGGATLTYLNSHAPRSVTLDGSEAADVLTIAASGSGTSVALTATVNGHGGDDTINLNFPLTGVVHGGEGHDTINGSGGNDRLYGDNGNDIIHGGAGRDIIDGGAGDNFLYGDAGNDNIVAGDGNNYVDGGADSDVITTGAGNDTIFGGAGHDVIHGGGGNDILHGGGDDDAVYGDGGHDVLYADGGNDTLHGGTESDTLYDGGGLCSLYGDDGNDQLVVTGTDSLYGGAGADLFDFRALAAAPSTIKDFGAGDQVDISHVLTYYDPLTMAIADFVSVTASGANTVISVDVDGAAGGSHYAALAIIQNVHTDLATLLATAQLAV